MSIIYNYAKNIAPITKQSTHSLKLYINPDISSNSIHSLKLYINPYISTNSIRPLITPLFKFVANLKLLSHDILY